MNSKRAERFRVCNRLPAQPRPALNVVIDGLAEAAVVEAIDPGERQGLAVTAATVLNRPDQDAVPADDVAGRARGGDVDQDRITAHGESTDRENRGRTRDTAHPSTSRG